MNKEAKIYLAGHRGMVGSAIMRGLQQRDYRNIVTRTHAELDLTRQDDVERFFGQEKPEYVFLGAARVGGILANATHKAEFLYDNTAIGLNVIHSAFSNGVLKLLNLGSSCIYPREAPQPLKEEYLLTGPLEETNDAYAIAKITAIKICSSYNQRYGTDFLSLMPTNLYGPNDNYDLDSSHVMAAMIRKIHDAKKDGGEVALWGDGSPRREFLYVDDLADAVIYIMEHFTHKDLGEFVNIGTGTDIPLKELAGLIAEIIEYKGEFSWDTSKPNGTPRKLLDVSRVSALGWKASTSLREGIQLAYRWFIKHWG